MKRLNKITLILVAIMGIMISGCGGDIEKAPLVKISTGNDSIELTLNAPCYNLDFYKTDEAINKCFVEWRPTKIKLISLKGRRDCSKLSIENNIEEYYVLENKFTEGKIVIKPTKDCPPKDRANIDSYEFTIQTDYGTFKYDAGGKSRIHNKGYLPIK